MTVPGWLIYRTIWRCDMERLISVLNQRLDAMTADWPY